MERKYRIIIAPVILGSFTKLFLVQSIKRSPIRTLRTRLLSPTTKCLLDARFILRMYLFAFLPFERRFLKLRSLPNRSGRIGRKNEFVIDLGRIVFLGKFSPNMQMREMREMGQMRQVREMRHQMMLTHPADNGVLHLSTFVPNSFHDPYGNGRHSAGYQDEESGINVGQSGAVKCCR